MPHKIKQDRITYRILYRLADPIRYAYQTTKDNAKRRGHGFTLTLLYFRTWCEENNYIELKGRFAHNMSIDRIVPELGYADGNIQILSVSENVIKQRRAEIEEMGSTWKAVDVEF